MQALHELPATTLDALLTARLQAINELKRQPEYAQLFFSGTYGGHPPLCLRFAQPVECTKICFRLQDEAEQLCLGGITLAPEEARQDKAVFSFSPEPPVFSATDAAVGQDITQAFSTSAGEAPRAYIHFAKPVRLAGMTVTNREKQLWRNHSLQISLTDAAGKEETVFEQAPLVSSFMAALAASRQEHPLAQNCVAAVQQLDTIFLTLIYDACPKAMADLNIDDVALLTKIKHRVSEAVFFPNEREITTHGIIRSFRFWSKDERVAYLSDAMDTISQLKHISPYVTFAYGSVLGFVRESDGHIPHDADHDMLVFLPEKDHENHLSALAYIEKQLQALGMQFAGREEEMLVTKVVGPRSGHDVDIFIALYDEDNFVSTQPLFLGKYLHMNMIFPTAEVTVCGLHCPVPRNAIDYLTATFGKNWRTPLNTCINAKHNEKLLKSELA